MSRAEEVIEALQAAEEEKRIVEHRILVEGGYFAKKVLGEKLTRMTIIVNVLKEVLQDTEKKNEHS